MELINFSLLNKKLPLLKEQFTSGIVEFCVIDEFLDKESAKKLLTEIPNPEQAHIGKSRDYIFAKNKYEKSDLGALGPYMAQLKLELLSDPFKDFLRELTQQEVFVDPSFHGGGLHQGGKGSFLDMHVDFNYHPLQNDWFRNLNILIYLNDGWEKSHKGELKLKNKKTGEQAEVEPLFNRCVIMFTRDYTLHGYDAINFPENTFRRSVAAYAYSYDHSAIKDIRSTKWYADDSNFIKKLIGLSWPKLVYFKTKLFGSGTSNNK